MFIANTDKAFSQRCLQSQVSQGLGRSGPHSLHFGSELLRYEGNRQSRRVLCFTAGLMEVSEDDCAQGGFSRWWSAPCTFLAELCLQLPLHSPGPFPAGPQSPAGRDCRCGLTSSSFPQPELLSGTRTGCVDWMTLGEHTGPYIQETQVFQQLTHLD